MSTMHPLVELAVKADAQRKEARLYRFIFAMFTAKERLDTLTGLLMSNEAEGVKIEERHIKRAERLKRQIEEILS